MIIFLLGVEDETGNDQRLKEKRSKRLKTMAVFGEQAAAEMRQTQQKILELAECVHACVRARVIVHEVGTKTASDWRNTRACART